ncbi:HAD-IIB family hydrolase [Kaarinaea lacus]
MKPNFLVCSDLDRTILPNGAQPESPQARPKLHQLTARPQVMLVYVSGRHEALLREAIRQYRIPLPDYAIGDVGTTIYEVHGGRWRLWEEWSANIAPDWNGAQHPDLVEQFNDLTDLQLQEVEKQNTFKLSYYTVPDLDHEALINEMNARLIKQRVKASLIWSVDEAANLGLLDVLPESATKLHAVQFLRERQGFELEQTVFAGDSGNDLPVVSSGELQSILVKNAHVDVINAATQALHAKGASEQLYVAQGGFLQMNGNYSAGVLEGVAHFLPQTKVWLE